MIFEFVFGERSLYNSVFGVVSVKIVTFGLPHFLMMSINKWNAYFVTRTPRAGEGDVWGPVDGPGGVETTKEILKSKTRCGPRLSSTGKDIARKCWFVLFFICPMVRVMDSPARNFWGNSLGKGGVAVYGV